MSESTITFEYQQSESERSHRSFFSELATGISNIKDQLTKRTRVKSSSVYYLSNQGSIRQSGLSPDNCIVDLKSLHKLKGNWGSGDVVRFRRGEIFEDNGVIASLTDAGVFLDAYGAGQNPIIKSGSEYVEIESTCWM